VTSPDAMPARPTALLNTWRTDLNGSPVPSAPPLVATVGDVLGGVVTDAGAAGSQGDLELRIARGAGRA